MTKAKTPKTKAPPRRVGRPSGYTPELGIRICTMIARGKSLVSIAKMPGLPHDGTVRQWLRENAEFATAFARAREQKADTLFEQIIDLADSATEKNARVRQLQIDARKFSAAKINPKSYGDRQQLDVSLDMNLRAMSDGDLKAAIGTLAAELGFSLGVSTPVMSPVVDLSTDKPDD